ncbi:hypothetical protein SeMB42_g04422 [Synchytrium endobioticum]|uniref:EF-hand domain-containing protein n=1 Tax=Synchytrium endobioticum TaxID=286115 RepID=A0A507CYC3_9FUNG|nr:hypothetical protein SeLEV6574_g06776 [Synchytrium endobioticum]TPX44145.1 hypothetical protein SeMB42_g04422 [Synchytrium endobioticum]
MSNISSAQEYLEKHQLPALLERLTAEVLYHQPENVQAFLVSRLSEISRDGSAQSFFSTQDLKSLFGTFDRLDTGQISLIQYQEAMKIIGADKTANMSLPPPITEDIFLAEAQKALSS